MTEKPFIAGAAICPACCRTFTKDAPWKLVCIKCYLARKAAPAPAPPPLPQPIAPDMLHRLIQLCHPDRHRNSEAANTATRFLLELKARSTGPP